MEVNETVPEGEYIRFIDLDKVIEGKSPRLRRNLPGFLLRYLKRIVHQDELNKALNKHKDKYGLEFFEVILNDFGVNIAVKGEENLLKSERFVVVANHPLGGLDGIALMQAVGRIRPDIVSPANDFLMHLPNLRSLFIPVNKHGSNATNIAVFNETFASDKTIVYFPAGLCSRKTGGEILDLEWKKTFLSKARAYNRDILPVHISGRNSGFFYNLANFRKWLGLKANIEMLFLVDEMFKQKNKDIVITFGKPVELSTFTKKHSDQKWAELLRSHVYKLEKDPDLIFNAD
ncbi:MAG: glycerol acyltransferase [Bacteroidetes bacterium HGW-Bacteroidetes-11]|jgi:putative hemolysin|nr:MAG: glycerol acyltransferase [Bacteroidetes bacterium HGW-Bacteroidetes-11]